MRCLIWLLTASSIFFGPLFAEPCSMVGCQGQVGYVFLPAGAKLPRNYFLGRHSCSIEPSVQPFAGDSLPKVNAAVSVRDERGLFDEAELAGFINRFQRLAGVSNKEGRSCRTEWSEPRASRLLDSGVKLRILGYRTLLGHHTVTGQNGSHLEEEELLFAMVLVED